MARLDGNFHGVLEAFLAAHPPWSAQQFVTDQGGDAEEWLSIPLVREATRWARQQRLISWDMATTIETVCRRADNLCESLHPASPEGDDGGGGQASRTPRT